KPQPWSADGFVGGLVYGARHDELRVSARGVAQVSQQQHVDDIVSVIEGNDLHDVVLAGRWPSVDQAWLAAASWPQAPSISWPRAASFSASRSARQAWSLMSRIIAYSIDTRRLVCCAYAQAASSTSSTFQRLLIGTSSSRSSSSGACSDNASVTGMPSVASWL